MVGTNVLRNSTSLARCDFGTADVIEQRRFSVVNVAHHGHHRGA